MTGQIRITEVNERRGYFHLTISVLDKPLVCSRMLLEKHRLKAGIVLTPPQLAQLKQEAELEACDTEAARLLALREHSVGEMRIKLKRKKFGDADIKKVLSKYRRLGLLDDTRYAQGLVRGLMGRNPSGRSILIAHLRRKMIDRELAERVVDMALEGTEEADLALASLQRRWSRLSQFDIETARRKAYNYLSRRGMSYEAARAAFEKMSSDSRKDTDD